MSALNPPKSWRPAWDRTWERYRAMPRRGWAPAGRIDNENPRFLTDGNVYPMFAPPVADSRRVDFSISFHFSFLLLEESTSACSQRKKNTVSASWYGHCCCRQEVRHVRSS